MSEPQALDWRTWIQQGAELFRKGRSAEAVSSFEKACESSPGTAVPHLYLAIALHQQYIPGALSSENTELARRSEMELRRAWDLDPQSWTGRARTRQSITGEFWGMWGVTEGQRASSTKQQRTLRNPSASIRCRQ